MQEHNPQLLVTEHKVTCSQNAQGGCSVTWASLPNVPSSKRGQGGRGKGRMRKLLMGGFKWVRPLISAHSSNPPFFSRNYSHGPTCAQGAGKCCLPSRPGEKGRGLVASPRRMECTAGEG